MREGCSVLYDTPDYEPLLSALSADPKYAPYSPTPNGACDVNGQKDANLFVVPYDFRRSMADAAGVLASTMVCVRQKWPAKPVVLVAHGAGGLVARRYILDQGAAHGIKYLVTVGTPFLGESLSLNNLLEVAPTHSPSPDLRRILFHFAGTHELLPSATYFQLLQGYWLNKYPLGLYNDPSGATDSNPFMSFAGYAGAIDGRFGFPVPPAAATKAFHERPGQDDWRTDASGIGHLNIVGVQPNTPIGAVVNYDKKTVMRMAQYVFRDVTKNYGPGDGLTSVLSASRKGALFGVPKTPESADWDFGEGRSPAPGTDANLNSPNSHLYLVFGDKGGHSRLISNPETAAAILDLALNDKYPQTVDPPMPAFREIVLSSIGSFGIYDASTRWSFASDTLAGNFTPFSEILPGVHGYQTGPNHYTVTLPASEGFTFYGWSGFERATIRATEGLPNAFTRVTQFEVPPNVVGGFRLDVTATGVELLSDQAGDGTYVSVPPTIDAAGAVAQDRTPPTVALEPGARKNEFRITATDAESGVRAAYFSIGGAPFIRYEAPFVVPTADPPLVVSAYAEDNAGNRSGLDEREAFGLPVVLVVGALPPSAADSMLQARLELLGYDVELVLAKNVSARSVRGKRLVVVSESSRSADIDDRLRSTTTPVLTLEPAILDEMGMTGPSWAADYGDAQGQQSLDIGDRSHVAAAGLAGSLTVTTIPEKFVWGRPGPSATTVATLKGRPDRAAVFLYPQGASMFGLRAPGRRAAFFAGATAPAAFTTDGAALFDALVRWSVRGQAPALLVTAPGPLEPGDDSIRQRLQASGHDVIVRPDWESTSEDANGVAVVVISESVSSAQVEDKFRDVVTPVLVLEPAVMDEMELTGPRWAVDYGVSLGASAIDVINPVHPIAAGLSGQVEVLSPGSKMTWGVPGSGAIRIASVSGSPSRLAIFAFDGNPFTGEGVMTGRRVGFFTAVGAAANLTSAGGSLFDSAVAWAESY